VTVQKIYPRTNPAPLEASENANVKPLDGEGLREFLRQDAAMRRAPEGSTQDVLRREPEGSTQDVLRREPESATQVVTDVNSLVQRVAGVSLTQLQNVIFDLQDLSDFLHSEGERIQGEISNYLQLSQTAMGKSKIVSDNIAHWKEKGAGAARPLEKRHAEIERANVAASVSPPVTGPAVQAPTVTATAAAPGAVPRSAWRTIWTYHCAACPADRACCGNHQVAQAPRGHIRRIGSNCHRIVSDQYPGIAWTPVMRWGHVARRETLAKVLRKRAVEIAKRAGRP
jgi:hypothetical protein